MLLDDYPLVLLNVQEYSYVVSVLVHYVTYRHCSLVSLSSFKSGLSEHPLFSMGLPPLYGLLAFKPRHLLSV